MTPFLRKTKSKAHGISMLASVLALSANVVALKIMLLTLGAWVIPDTVKAKHRINL